MNKCIIKILICIFLSVFINFASIAQSNQLITGLKLPRITTLERDQILIDGNEASRGLIIYNLDIDCIQYWNGTDWKSFCGDLEPAKFTISDCSLITISGKYATAEPLTATNFVTIPVDVTTKGSFTVFIEASPYNGYYFATTEEFLKPGHYDIKVPGFGSPVNFSNTGSCGDDLIVKINNENISCTNKLCLFIKDGSVKPYYSVVCKNLNVFGNYRKNVALDQTNYVKLRIEVLSAAVGAEWSAETNLIDGIKFQGSGVLPGTGTQEIILYGQGTPLFTDTKYFTLSTNSEISSETCGFYVIPLIPPKRIVEFGANQGTTNGLASTNILTGGPIDLLSDGLNFGTDPNSIVHYSGSFYDVTHVSAASTVTAATLRTYTQGANPYDIIFFTHDARPANQDAINELNSYLNRGGVVIQLDQYDDDRNLNVIKTVFDMQGTTSIPFTSILSNCHQVIKITSAIDDDITNGPFGDVRGKQWGEDFNNTIGINILPPGAIVYSAAVDASTGTTPSAVSNVKATMLRHPTKHYFWCGDSGLISGATGDALSGPFRVGTMRINGIDYIHYPIDKQNYGSGLVNKPVCNSTIFANIVAWALKMANENGINP